MIATHCQKKASENEHPYPEQVFVTRDQRPEDNGSGHNKNDNDGTATALRIHHSTFLSRNNSTIVG